MAETKPIHWAADLVDALKASGTGQHKLKLIQDAMVRRFNHAAHADKDSTHPDRHLTSSEAIAVLEKHGVGDQTIKKAKSLAKTGSYELPKPLNPADSLPKPPAMPAPERDSEELAPSPPLKHIAGVADVGARNVETIGPKPFTPPPEPEAEPAKVEDDKPAGKKPGGRRGGTGAKDLLPASDPAE